MSKNHKELKEIKNFIKPKIPLFQKEIKKDLKLENKIIISKKKPTAKQIEEYKPQKKISRWKQRFLQLEANKLKIEVKPSPDHPSPLREWKNSIYVYNKNSLNLIPSTTVSINNTIKSYFYFYNKSLEVKMRTKRLLLRLRRLSSNKYYISNGGFKHTNNKVLINLYVFNRQKTNYLLTLKKWFLKKFLKKRTRREKNVNIKLIKRLNLINRKGIQKVKKLNKDKYLLIKALNSVLKNKNYNINTFKALSYYTESFYKNLIKKSLKKIRMYFYYKQLVYINKSKLNYTYLQSLKKHLENFYNKNVEFNIINIKRFYLNSDILSESITTKLSRNRRKMLKYLSRLKNKVKIKLKRDFLETSSFSRKRKNIKKYNLSRESILRRKYIFKNLRHKHVTGYRLEAKGRLSKRFTASRSVSKLSYKGNLLNIYSSVKRYPSLILKGNLKSNTQYTILKSKSRIGSFGIKGWVSGN